MKGVIERWEYAIVLFHREHALSFIIRGYCRIAAISSEEGEEQAGGGIPGEPDGTNGPL